MNLERSIAFTVYEIEALCCLVFTSVDFLILIHLSFIQKKKGFSYVLALSMSSFLGLTFWALVPVYELHILPRTQGLLYYRCEVYAWLDNTFFCANAYIIVALSVDRFVALYKPHSYYIWARVSTRVVVTLICFLLAFCVTSKWYNFVIIEGSFENQTAYCTENVDYTHDPSYKAGKMISILLQYYTPAVLMVTFTSLNIRKIRRLKKQYQTKLKTYGASYKSWLENWDRMTKISVGLAITFCFTNLPFSIFEFDFRQAAYTKFGFRVFQFVTNLLQILNTQINILLICYFSVAYRNTAKTLIAKICRCVKCTNICEYFSRCKNNDNTYEMQDLRF